MVLPSFLYRIGEARNTHKDVGIPYAKDPNHVVSMRIWGRFFHIATHHLQYSLQGMPVVRKVTGTKGPAKFVMVWANSR